VSGRAGIWQGVRSSTRQHLVLELAELVEQNAELLAALATLETGVPLARTRSEVELAVATLRFFANGNQRVKRALTGAVLSVPVGGTINVLLEKENMERRDSVVCVLLPWSRSVVHIAWRWSVAFLAGSAVVTKPSEHGSLVALKMALLCREAGFPPGLVTVLPGGAETGKRRLEDYRVAMVTFSGSREVGREVERLCRSPLGSNSTVVSVRRRCLVEVDKPGLLVVMEDMVGQVDAVADFCLRAALEQPGHNCCSAKEIFVQEDIFEALSGCLKSRVENLRVGNPFADKINFGPLAALERCEAFLLFLKKMLESGGEILGKAKLTVDDPTSGFFALPMLLRAPTRPSHFSKNAQNSTLRESCEISSAIDSDFPLLILRPFTTGQHLVSFAVKLTTDI